MYEIFEHTADLGIRVEADSFASLLVDAARALTSVLVANPDAIEPAREVEFVIAGAGPEDVLVDWLSELLYRFSAEHMLFARFEIACDPQRVSARLWGELLDEARHQLDTEVKAITYHRLKVEQAEGRWRAEVIVDL